MMETFIISSTAFDGEIILEYHANGILHAFNNYATLNTTQLNWLAKNFPITGTQANEMIAKTTTLKCKHIPAEITFDMFWDAYAYKVDKQNALKVWNKLSVLDKTNAIDGCKPYDKYLLRKNNMEKRYPERYLKNRGWETDWNKLK